MLKRLYTLITNRAATSNPVPSSPPGPEMIDPDEAREAQKNGARLIDVRERDEWDAGHVEGALFYPVPRISSDPDIDVDPNTPIVTYCKAGARAERAAEVLRAAGYTDVCAMRGGFDDWRDAGYPTE